MIRRALAGVVVVFVASVSGAAADPPHHYEFSSHGWTGTLNSIERLQKNTAREQVDYQIAVALEVRENGDAVANGGFRIVDRTNFGVQTCTGGRRVNSYEETRGEGALTDQLIDNAVQVGQGGDVQYERSIQGPSVVVPGTATITEVDCGGTDTREITYSPSVGYYITDAGPSDPETPKLQGTSTRTASDGTVYTLKWNLTGCGEELGPQWPQHFPPDNRIEALNEPFRGKVKRFVAALKAAGASVTVISVYRPSQRNYLMHHAWRVAYGDEHPDIKALRPGRPIRPKYSHEEPEEVPPYSGEGAAVPICWTARDPGLSPGEYDRTLSIGLARDLVKAYGVKLSHGASATSKHADRTGLDMAIKWTGTLRVRNGARACRGDRPSIHCWIEIDSKPRDSQNPRLWAVGETYGVRKYKDSGDPEHWSATGN